MERIERDGFVFYKSFYDALKSLDDANIKWKIVEAICEYGLNGNEIELDAISRMAFNLVRPQLDANNKRYLNGKKGASYGSLGGRPKIETPDKPLDNPKKTPKKPQENPNQTPNDNVNVNVNENVNVNDNIYNKVNNTIPFISLPLIDKTNYDVSDDVVKELQSLYLAVDIKQELRNMKGWLNANPTKRKTRRGINKFINSWLAKRQDNPKYHTTTTTKETYIRPDKVCEENEILTEEEILAMIGE